MEAVRAEHPQVVLAAVRGEDIPAATQFLARLDHIAARHAVQVQAVVDVEHRRGRAGIGEQQPDRAVPSVFTRADVQLIGQGARRARAGVLLGHLLAARRRHRHLRQHALRGADRVGADLVAIGQRGQRVGVGADEVEGRDQVPGHRAAEAADIAFHDAKAGL
ncbi:hypothetical protein D3C72_1683790 [compost metagenome]